MKPDRRKAAWQEVAQAVERLAGQGLAPVDRDWETLAVLLEAAGPEEAARALATPDHPGLEPAWGFLLQPDSGFQERLEPILARAKLGEEDEESLARHLSGLPLSVRIALPGGGERVLDAPPEAVKSLVRHLGLSACFPPGLAAALDSLEEKTRFHCRVLARNAMANMAKTPAGPAASFLARMADSLGKETDFPELFRLALHVLVLAKTQQDPALALADYAQWCNQALAMADNDDARLTGMNPETRLAMGLRPAYVDRLRMEARLTACCRILAVLAPGLAPLPGFSPASGPSPYKKVSPDAIRDFIRQGLED